MADPEPEASVAAARRRRASAEQAAPAAKTDPKVAPTRSRGRAKMSGPEAPPQAQPAPMSLTRPRRAANQVEPSPARRRTSSPARAQDPLEAAQLDGPTHRAGDVPASLSRKYFTEPARGGASVAFYEGPGAKTVAFHDHGARLATEHSHPGVVRDLVAIAAHRGWRALEVKGSDEFRRELWLEARALGLEVKGYKPRERDQQELDRRRQTTVARPLEAAQAKPQANTPSRGSRSPPRDPRPDYEAGVTGVLVASGEAPYRRRAGEAPSPFIRIDRGGRRMLDIWGVGLPQALSRSGARVGDVVQVRREGVEVVQQTVRIRDPRAGTTSPQLRDVTRARWVIEAERFRSASPADAARDSQLGGAQSHLAVLNTVIDRSIKDPEGRARLRAEARDIVADEIAQGRRFAPARIREVEPALARDIGQAHAREAAAERVRRR